MIGPIVEFAARTLREAWRAVPRFSWGRVGPFWGLISVVLLVSARSVVVARRWTFSVVANRRRWAIVLASVVVVPAGISVIAVDGVELATHSPAAAGRTVSVAVVVPLGIANIPLRYRPNWLCIPGSHTLVSRSSIAIIPTAQVFIPALTFPTRIPIPPTSAITTVATPPRLRSSRPWRKRDPSPSTPTPSFTPITAASTPRHIRWRRSRIRD